MTDTRTPALPLSTRGGTVATSVVAILVALAETGFGAYCWYLTEIDTSDDPLVGIGYLIAVAIGAPGVLGLVLGGLAWLLADRVAGLVLAILAAVAVALPVLLFLFFASPTL